VKALTQYQNRAYGARYAAAVAAVRAAEARALPGVETLARACADSLYRVMAIKDEYEVARLYTDGDFARMVAGQFEGDYRLHVHLSPPLLAGEDPATGRPAKRSFGPSVFLLFRLLKHLKFLRGGAFDPFGWTDERRAERRLRESCLALAGEIARDLTPARHDIAVALMAAPQRIRGYGPVKMAAMAAVEAGQAPLLAAFREDEPPAPLARAAE
jgi:indolepyruvate ferredoxin oxidoreductase